ncbi:MAG: type IV secretory system conjugative DNA transfer family protein, partial [Caldilineaceae bacterium]|nr:type IV secretory system conjugative DNA transfer family protein [Caldilineaceae bacterium]
MGKSKFLESLVMQDIMQGRAVGLIDIHGDLFHHVRQYIAALTLKHPELAKRVVIVDPTCPEHTVSINPLEAIAGQSQERTALFLTDIVIKVWQIEPNTSPRLVWLLTNSFLALANLGLTLADFPRWLQDKVWRNSLVPRITHEAVARYWANEFPRSDKEIQQWIAPAANKLGGILFDADVQHVLTGSSHISMRDVLDQGLILLVHIPKGILGERSAFLLGAFIVAQIQKAALSRANTPDRRQFYFYLDEFHNFTTDYIQDVLAESRKYGLSLVLAHQFLDQLDTKLRSAVINTVGTLVSFRIGYKDARAIVYEMFPTPDFPRYQGDIDTGSW